MSKKKVVKEDLKINLLGKMLFATVGAWLVGKVVNTKIRGTKEEISALSSAMVASKKFQEELNHPGATVESVVEKLKVKHMTAKEFEKVFNVPWPL